MFHPLISTSERFWPDHPSETCCGAADPAAEDEDWVDATGVSRGERSPEPLDTEDFVAAGDSLADDVGTPADADSAVVDCGDDSLAVGVLSLLVISDISDAGATAVCVLPFGLGDAAFGVTPPEWREAGVAVTSWSALRGCKNNPPVIVVAASPRAIRGRVIRFGIKVPLLNGT